MKQVIDFMDPKLSIRELCAPVSALQVSPRVLHSVNGTAITVEDLKGFESQRLKGVVRKLNKQRTGR